MRKRIHQFLSAMTARLSPTEIDFVRQTLPIESWAFFFAMHPADQTHCYRVAMTALRLQKNLGEGDGTLLVRAALLHDIGRKKGELNIWGKVLTVLLVHFFPIYSRRVAKGESPAPFHKLSRMLYIYFQHPRIGAQQLKNIGLEEEAALVERHHAPPAVGDSVELALLRQADELN